MKLDVLPTAAKEPWYGEGLRFTVLDQFEPDAGVELVVLDLDGVTFLGTSGLAVLIEVREAAHTAGVELRLACTARRVLRPLTIAGLIPLFDNVSRLFSASRLKSSSNRLSPV